MIIFLFDRVCIAWMVVDDLVMLVTWFTLQATKSFSWDFILHPHLCTLFWNISEFLGLLYLVLSLLFSPLFRLYKFFFLVFNSTFSWTENVYCSSFFWLSKQRYIAVLVGLDLKFGYWIILEQHVFSIRFCCAWWYLLKIIFLSFVFFFPLTWSCYFMQSRHWEDSLGCYRRATGFVI